MAEFKKLKSYMATNSKKFPKLVPALKALSEFVGHEDRNRCQNGIIFVHNIPS